MDKRDVLKHLPFPIIVGIVIGIVVTVIGFGIELYKTSRKVIAIIEGPFSCFNIHELFDNAQIAIVAWWGKNKPKANTEPEKPRDPRGPSGVGKLGVSVKMDVNELQI